MSSSVLLASFSPSADGHGGNHRALQLQFLLAEVGCDPILLPYERRSNEPRWMRIAKRFWHGVKMAVRHRLPPWPWGGVLGNAHYQATRDVLRSANRPSLVVWETTTTPGILYAALESSVPIIVAPANIHSLQKDYCDPVWRTRLPWSLESELARLRKCEAVFCISREEQWLMRTRDIDAAFLPYYPAKNILEHLLELRRLREDLEHEHFLILGTAINPPTMVGMAQQLAWLREGLQAGWYPTPPRIHVVGSGTEELAKGGPQEGVTVHGRVSADKLDELLLHAKAVLVHQQSAVGALTRIVEALVAGVPVIANEIAARSMHGLAGVHIYGEPRELAAALALDKTIPPVPERPVAAERRFQETVLRIIEGGQE